MMAQGMEYAWLEVERLGGRHNDDLECNDGGKKSFSTIQKTVLRL